MCSDRRHPGEFGGRRRRGSAGTRLTRERYLSPPPGSPSCLTAPGHVRKRSVRGVLYARVGDRPHKRLPAKGFYFSRARRVVFETVMTDREPFSFPGRTHHRAGQCPQSAEKIGSLPTTWVECSGLRHPFNGSNTSLTAFCLYQAVRSRILAGGSKRCCDLANY
jgi:hypothetical protein